MKTQRCLALVCSLLMIGVLIAPVPSEAAPTLTVSGATFVGSTVTLGTSSTCSGTDKSAGYTACFAIPTPQTFGSGSDTWTLQNVLSTNPARLLIADKDGSGNSLDLFTLTGVKFIPPSSGGFLRVDYTNTFDAAANPAGNYQFALRTAGYFVAGDGSNVNDTVNFFGGGDFGIGCCSALGPTLSVVVTGPAATIVSFTLAQTPEFSTNACDNGSGKCTPTLTLSMVFSVSGPDTLNLTNSNDGAGGIGTCDVVSPTVPPSPPFGLPQGPARPCPSNASQTPIENQITNFFNNQETKDARAAMQAGAVPCLASCYTTD